MSEDLTRDADALIEKWRERQEAKPEPEAPAGPQEVQAGQDNAQPRPGVQIIVGETFPWKDLLWQVLGFTKAIPKGEEEPVDAVVIRALAPVARGWGRAARRRAERGR
jgi:hypothetical protein